MKAAAASRSYVPSFSLLAAAVVAIGIVIEWMNPLNGDAASCLYTARRLVRGERLYVDIAEINPPLVVWLNVPLVLLGRVAKVSDVTLFRLAVLAMAMGVCWVSDRLLRQILTADESLTRRALLLTLLIVLVTVPAGGFFGEREHLVLALFVLAVFATAVRRKGRRVAAGLELLIGCMKAIAIALKPHFALLWIGLWLRGRRAGGGSGDGGAREEVVAAGLLVAYAIAVWLGAPDYVRIVRWLGPLYWSYENRSVGAILTQGPMAVAVWGAVVTWLLIRSTARERDLLDTLGLAMLLGVAAVLAQHKGLGYHFYPALGFALLLCAAASVGPGSGSTRLRSALGRASGVLVGVAFASLFVAVAASRARALALDPRTIPGRELSTFLRARGGAVGVVIFSPMIPDAFPTVLEAGVDWASRHPSMWFVQALYREQLAENDGPIRYRSPDEMSAVERWCLHSVGEDLERYRPSLLVVRKPTRDRSAYAPLRIDYLAYFLADPTFRAEFAHYEPEAEVGKFAVYRRRDGAGKAGGF